MNSKENIVFLGMMGSGKTSIGKLISKKLNLNFFDVDEQIEIELGLKISKIFLNKGEKYFREVEEKKTLELLENKKSIIAIGGGAFLNKNIRKEITENHLSFWLKWSNETLINRIRNSRKRPLAFNTTIENLNNLIKKRSNIYSKALYKIDCDNLTKNEIMNKILNIYDN